MIEEKKLAEVFGQFQKKIDLAIENVLLSYVSPKFKELVWHQIATGGKRIRPFLAIIACRLLGGNLKDVIYPAAGLEILHNYTLIIDDIIDHSTLRRNQPTVWTKYGKSTAECIAIDYCASVFQAAESSSNPIAISNIFAKTMKEIVEGEIADILFERVGREEEPYILKNRYKKITKNDYLDMISKKTASLLQASCLVGAVCAKADKKAMQGLKNYGFNLGIIFQIQDDILDMFGKEEKFGKKIGKDIEERKGGNITLLFALEELSKKEKNRIFKIMSAEKITERNKKEIIGLIKKTKALEKSVALGKCFIQKAKNSLKGLPQNKWRKVLEEIVDFTLERSH